MCSLCNCEPRWNWRAPVTRRSCGGSRGGQACMAAGRMPMRSGDGGRIMPGGGTGLQQGDRRRWAIRGAPAVLAAGLSLLMAVPQVVLAGSRARARPAISASGAHSCSLQNGQAYCWGDDGYGELGDGTTNSSAGPVAVDTRGVLARKTLIQISTGTIHACAVDRAGAAYCWGGNASGQLGHPAAGDSAVPVAVATRGVLAGKALTQISAGDDNTCAQDSAGADHCWGSNLSGELGDGLTIVQSSVPVAVDSLAPQPPGGVAARAGNASALVSWTAPVSLGTGTLTGYAAIARPGGRFCATRNVHSC